MTKIFEENSKLYKIKYILKFNEAAHNFVYSLTTEEHDEIQQTLEKIEQKMTVGNRFRMKTELMNKRIADYLQTFYDDKKEVFKVP
jgi:hypothetical protein